MIKNVNISKARTLAIPRLDRVSVPSRIAVDISDGTQWRGTELT